MCQWLCHYWFRWLLLACLATSYYLDDSGIGGADWFRTNDMLVDRMSDALCDNELWTWPWPWIFKAKVISQTTFSNFLNENVQIFIPISLKLVPKSPIFSKSALVQLMAWHQSGPVFYFCLRTCLEIVSAKTILRQFLDRWRCRFSISVLDRRSFFKFKFKFLLTH